MSERPERSSRAQGRSRPVKAVVVIAMAAAIATLGLDDRGGAVHEAVADDPLEGHFDPLMPRYPRVGEFPLGEKLYAGGGEMRMSYFSTPDPPLRVARYYQTVWEREGLRVDNEVTAAGGVVGTYDPRTKAARSVTIVTASGRSWVFPATVSRPLSTADSGELGAEVGLPVYPDSTRGLTLRTSDEGRGSLVTTYTNTGGLAKNRSFYLREMESRGWRREDVPSFEELDRHVALQFEKGAERCTINLTPVGDDGRQVIVSVILEGDGGSHE